MKKQLCENCGWWAAENEEAIEGFCECEKSRYRDMPTSSCFYCECWAEVPNREVVIQKAAMSHLRRIVVLMRNSKDKHLKAKLQKPISAIANLLGPEVLKCDPE